MVQAIWYGIDEDKAGERALTRIVERAAKQAHKGKDKKMATTVANPVQTKRVTRSVFDLQEFDQIQLGKDVPLPPKPEDVPACSVAVGNDAQRFVEVFYAGLCQLHVDAERERLEGFQVFNDEGELGEPYTGTPVSEEKGKLIAGAVLGMAKAMGYSKSLPPAQKRALKEQAMNVFRNTPALLASIKG